MPKRSRRSILRSGIAAYRELPEVHTNRDRVAERSADCAVGGAGLLQYTHPERAGDLPEERGVHRQDTIGSKSFAYLDGESNRPQSFISICQNGSRRVDVVELREFARLYGKPLNFFVS